jgi:hypothetical protein
MTSRAGLASTIRPSRMTRRHAGRAQPALRAARIEQGRQRLLRATTEHTWTSKGSTDAVALWVLVNI